MIIVDQESSSSVRTARTEHVELVTALSELNEFQESRLQRQESLQAIENELRATENSEERPPRKKSKKSSSSEFISFLLFHAVFMMYTAESPDKSFKTNDGMIDADHYTADNGDIYARSRKQTRAAGMLDIMWRCNMLLDHVIRTTQGQDVTWSLWG